MTFQCWSTWLQGKTKGSYENQILAPVKDLFFLWPSKIKITAHHFHANWQSIRSLLGLYPLQLSIFNISAISLITLQPTWFHQCRPNKSKTRSPSSLDISLSIPLTMQILCFWDILQYILLIVQNKFYIANKQFYWNKSKCDSCNWLSCFTTLYPLWYLWQQKTYFNFVSWPW